MKILLLIIGIFAYSVNYGSCWRSFKPLINYEMPITGEVGAPLHTEYVFGDCLKNPGLQLIHKVEIDSKDMIGNVIMRGWTPEIKQLPSCILIKGTSNKTLEYRDQKYNFQICVPKITILHSQKRFRFYYYEWYIPVGFKSDLKWVISFYYRERKFW